MFGDGAVNRGPFLEGLNWAVLYKLPVLFVCEDNGVAAFTRAESVTAGPGVIDRAKALGVAAITVDGNNVMAVDDAAPGRGRGGAPRRGAASAACAHLSHHRPHLDRCGGMAAGGGSRGGALARSDRAARRGAGRARRAARPSSGKIIDEAKAEMAEARRQANAGAVADAASVAFEDVQDTGAVAWSKSH